VKVQKNEILIQQERQLPTHIAHIAKASQANAKTKALSKSAIFAFTQMKCNYVR